MKMTFDRHEIVFVHEGIEYSSFEDAVKAALQIEEVSYKVYSCASCGSEERVFPYHSGNILCEYCAYKGNES